MTKRGQESADRNSLTIKTSEEGWFKELAIAYKDRKKVLLIDNANVGIDPNDQSLVRMGRRASLSRQDWAVSFIYK